MSRPTTIDDAEAEGWTWLEGHFACCRRETLQMPWRLLRGATTRTDLAEICDRVRCQRCGARPVRLCLAKPEPPRPGYPPDTVRLRLAIQPE